MKTGISCHEKVSDVAESGEIWEHCYTSWIVSVNLMDVIYVGVDIKRSHLSVILLFCTQRTFDLILSPRDIFRPDIHSFRVYYTYINVNSMDASFYSFLPSTVTISLFCLNRQPTISSFCKVQ